MLSWLLLNADDIASGANVSALSPVHRPSGTSLHPPQTHTSQAQVRPQQQELSRADVSFHSPEPFPQQNLMGYVPIYQNAPTLQLVGQQQLPSPRSSGSAGLVLPPALLKTESALSFGSTEDPASELLDFGDGDIDADGDGDNSVMDGSAPPNKRKKLQKNRESARECRKKQRVRAEELQDRVNELKAENEQLHAHVRATTYVCILMSCVQ